MIGADPLLMSRPTHRDCLIHRKQDEMLLDSHKGMVEGNLFVGPGKAGMAFHLQVSLMAGFQLSVLIQRHPAHDKTPTRKKQPDKTRAILPYTSGQKVCHCLSDYEPALAGGTQYRREVT
jgi:hypothetical protein